MPTALVPALAVAALLPLATPRPHANLSAQESAPAFPPRYATNFRSDIAIMGNGLVSCIEDDTTLIDKLSECLQDDVSFGENITSRTHISFGLLDEDWRHLQLLHQAMLPDNSFFKEKLILAFRALLASFYRTHSAQLINSKVESQNQSYEYNTVGNQFELSTERTDTTTISKTHLVVPTPTVETILDNDISNDIVYEGAGSDPKGSVVQPPVDSETKNPILNTDGPYKVSETTFNKGFYDSEGNVITNSLYDQETTTKEIKSLSKILRGLENNSYLLTSTTSLDSQGTQSDGPKNEFSFTIDDITLPEERLIGPTDLPYNQDNIEKSKGRGTDIDENELFPPPSAKAAENELNTTPNSNPAADDVKINNSFITSTVYYRTVGIPTDFSTHSSVNNKSISQGSDIVSEDYDEQNSQPTDSPIKQDFISRTPTTLEVGLVTPSSDLDVEGKEHESGYEENSTTPYNSHQENRGNSVDWTVQLTVPIDPITHAAYPVSISYTASSVDTGISKTDDNAKDFDIGVSSNPFTLDLPQYPKGHSIEIPVTLSRTTPPADPNPKSNSDMGLDNLEIYESEKNYSEINQSIILNTDTTTKKQITLATESNGNFHEDDKIRIEQITTQPTKTEHTDELFQKTEGDSDIKYDPSVSNENYLKHLNSSETSTLYQQRGTTPSPPSDSAEDNTNYVHQTENSRIASEVTKSSRDSIDLNVPELPTEISSTHDVDKNTFYSSGASDGTKDFTIPLLYGITSEEPELRGQTEQKPLVIHSIPLQGTTLSNLVSGYELDGYSNVPDDSTYKYTSEDPDISLHPDPVSPPPKSKDDDISSGSISISDENPTTAIFDNDRSNSESINVAEHTEENMRPITTNNTNWDFNRENRTESKNNFHSFSISLPEGRKSKQENIILNTLRIFPPSNNHILISQPSYKHGCLSQNDCVRVGNTLVSKQRRNPTVNLENGGKNDLQFSAVDKDSVLWWHKMRALKKKSR